VTESWENLLRVEAGEIAPPFTHPEDLLHRLPEAADAAPEKFVTGASPAKQRGSSVLARIL
jgi:hypothetical protein